MNTPVRPLAETQPPPVDWVDVIVRKEQGKETQWNSRKQTKQRQGSYDMLRVGPGGIWADFVVQSAARALGIGSRRHCFSRPLPTSHR